MAPRRMMMNAIIYLLVVFSILSLVLADRCGLNSECSSGLTTNCNQYCCTGKKFPEPNEADGCASVTCSCPTGYGYPAPSPTNAPVTAPTTPFNGYWLQLDKLNCGAGSDLAQISVDTISTCRSQCFTTNGCFGIVYTFAPISSPYLFTCWLKSSLASCYSSTSPTITTNILALPSYNTDFVYAPNFGCSIQNPTLLPVATGTPDDCFQLCLYPSCQGFFAHPSPGGGGCSFIGASPTFLNCGYDAKTAYYASGANSWGSKQRPTLSPSAAPLAPPSKAPTQQLTGTLAPTPFLSPTMVPTIPATTVVKASLDLGCSTYSLDLF